MSRLLLAFILPFFNNLDIFEVNFTVCLHLLDLVHGHFNFPSFLVIIDFDSFILFFDLSYIFNLLLKLLNYFVFILIPLLF